MADRFQDELDGSCQARRRSKTSLGACGRSTAPFNGHYASSAGVARASIPADILAYARAVYRRVGEDVATLTLTLAAERQNRTCAPVKRPQPMPSGETAPLSASTGTG